MNVTPRLIASTGGTIVRLEAAWFQAKDVWKCRFGMTDAGDALRSKRSV